MIEGEAVLDFRTIKLVSWDVDGTLYSARSMRLHLLQLLIRRVAAGEGRRALHDFRLLKRFHARIEAARSEEGTLGESNDTVDQEEMRSIQHRWYEPAIRLAGPQPGLAPVLSHFREKNVRQVAWSDYECDYKIDALGLTGWFAATYAGERLGVVKPNPGALERIASDFSTPIQSILHIGDRPETDARAAFLAGCPCMILGRDFKTFHTLMCILVNASGAE
jgi:putative hydrolase of the HAD superfamily